MPVFELCGKNSPPKKNLKSSFPLRFPPSLKSFGRAGEAGGIPSTPPFRPPRLTSSVRIFSNRHRQFGNEKIILFEMKKQINLHKRDIEYTFKTSKRARRIRLAVYCDGAFVVTAPQSMNESIIEQFIIKKSHWVIAKLEYFKKFPGWIFAKNSHRDYLKYKAEARTLALKRIEIFNQIYRYQFRRLNIKNQKTRWGSCSKTGSLNFNYKIALLPPHISDYIIVHELCHLGEFSHSPKFWSLVAKTIPDYLSIKNELKQNSLGS